MTIANMGYQALCLYIDNSFAITRISPLWAGLIGVCTFIAALLLTSKDKEAGKVRVYYAGWGANALSGPQTRKFN